MGEIGRIKVDLFDDDYFKTINLLKFASEIRGYDEQIEIHRIIKIFEKSFENNSWEIKIKPEKEKI